MTGWEMMIWGGVCAGGALILLTLVSHEIKRIELVMASFDRIEERASQRRQRRRERAASVQADEAGAAPVGTPAVGSASPVRADAAVPDRVAGSGPQG